MTWVAVGIGAGSAAAGAIQANQERQRKKGIIGRAYALGQQRLNLHQLDTREQVAEQSGERGLTGGGDVTAGRPASPGGSMDVSGAHTLGAQQTADLSREQTVEQNALVQQRDAAYSGVNAEATNAMIGSVQGGISAGFAAKSGLTSLQALKGAPGAGAAPMKIPAGEGLASASFMGVDPIRPLSRGTWAPAAGSTGAAAAASTTSDFNVNS